MDDFKASPDGKSRSKLLTRYNKQEREMKQCRPVSDPLSVNEVAEYHRLQKLFEDKTKPRDAAGTKKKALKDTLDVFRLERKQDPTSVHNQIKDYCKSKGLNCGKAFGGKFDGKDARKVMENPLKTSDQEMCNILIA